MSTKFEQISSFIFNEISSQENKKYQLRLFLFVHAGGTQSLYSSWAANFPDFECFVIVIPRSRVIDSKEVINSLVC